MKALALTIWLLIILADVIRNMRIIMAEYRTPDYGKTTLLRVVVGSLFNGAFWYIHGGVAFCFNWWSCSHDHGPWLQIGVMQLFVYAFVFDAMLNFGRGKHQLHMGEKSLPERVFAGKHLPYFIVKLWFFLCGLCMLYHEELKQTALYP